MRFVGRPYLRPGFTWHLTIAVDTGWLEYGFFTRPGYCHYYFGDYYDPFYLGIGIFPWFYHEHRYLWYDPIVIHHRWIHHRENPEWEKHLRSTYKQRAADKALRPPHTYREMERRVSSLDRDKRPAMEIAAPASRIMDRHATTLFRETAGAKSRGQVEKDIRIYRNSTVERRERESRNEPPSGSGHSVLTVPKTRYRTTVPTAGSHGPETPRTERMDSPPTITLPREDSRYPGSGRPQDHRETAPAGRSDSRGNSGSAGREVFGGGTNKSGSGAVEELRIESSPGRGMDRGGGHNREGSRK